MRSEGKLNAPVARPSTKIKSVRGVDPSIGSQFTTPAVIAVTETETKMGKEKATDMNKKVNKENWVAMFREIGLSDDQMARWHQLFDTRHPEGHEDFLVWLGISSDEIADIRSSSK